MVVESAIDVQPRMHTAPVPRGVGKWRPCGLPQMPEMRECVKCSAASTLPKIGA